MGSRAALPAWVGAAARFGVVGGLAAALDYAVLRAGIAGGLSRELARIPSLAASVTFTYFLNRRLTFRAAAPPSWREFGHYVTVALLGICLNLGVYWAALWAGLPVWAAFVLGTGLTAVFSFLRYRVVFAAR